MNTVVSQNDKQMKEIVEQNLRNYFYCHYSDITRAHQLITFPHDLCSNERKTYELNSYLQKCKILIVTANSVEQSVVTHCLAGRLVENSCKTSFELVDRFVADDYNYQIATCRLKNGIGDVQFAHLHAADISSNTDGGAKDAVLAALKRFRPNFVVSLGCAYGWDPSQSYGQELGDVLLSKELIAYSEKNKRTNNKLTFKSDVIYPISTELKPYLQTYEEEHNWVSKAFKAYYGSLLTGGSVLSDADEKSRIEEAVRHHDRVPIGGEMEGAGLRKACEAQKKRIPWLVIKGICDWGMEKNAWDSILEVQAMDEVNTERLGVEDIKKAIQAIATEHAFDTLLEMLVHNPQLCRDDSLPSLSKIQNDSFNWLKRVRLSFGNLRMRWQSSKQLKLLVGVVLIYISSLGIYLRISERSIINYIYNFYPFSVKEPESLDPLLANIVLWCILFLGLFLIYSALRLIPFQLSRDFAHINVSKSDELILGNAGNCPLYQVELMWINDVRLRPKLISRQQIQCLSIGETISLNMPEPLKTAPYKMSKDAILQLFYLTPESSCYFHMFIFISSTTYLEKVFRVEEHKCKLCASYRKVLGTVEKIAQKGE